MVKPTDETATDYAIELQKALAARDQFLANHPDYLPYQQEIDRILSKAGPRENRIAVLAMMMECKLNELSHQFQSLAGILKTTIGPQYCLECNRP